MLTHIIYLMTIASAQKSGINCQRCKQQNINGSYSSQIISQLSLLDVIRLQYLHYRNDCITITRYHIQKFSLRAKAMLFIVLK